MDRISAIVLSAGRGSRMNSEVPKQYIEIEGKPIIAYSLLEFEKSSVDEIILVVGTGDREFVQEELVNKYGLKKVSSIVEGGRERYNSVYNGLKAIKRTDYVLIHDGARPMLTQAIIERTIEAVREYKACVVGMPSKDTIKLSDENGCVKETLPRRDVWIIQTPQAFSFELANTAYNRLLCKSSDELESITDDAMVVERLTGHEVKLVEGSYDNIKITTPEDIKLFKMLKGK